MTLAALPEPPPNLAHLRLQLISLDGPFYRTHGLARNPLIPGNPRHNRFDAPDASYQVLYVAADPFCAFIETFAHTPGTRAVTTAALRARALAVLKPPRTLSAIDLTNPGSLVRLGVDARLFSGEYTAPQRWSKALHDHPAKADGILYPSRLDPARHGLAIFLDRLPKMVELSRRSWYAPGEQRALLATIAEHYQLELIETEYVASRKPPRRAAEDFLPFDE